MLVHWVWFATRKGMSDRVKAALLRQYNDPEDVYYADSYEQAEALSEQAVQSLLNKDLTRPREIIEQCRRKEIRILTLRDAAYPSRLKNIADPPMVLYYKGILPDFEELPLIGVVGTRKCSGYGVSVAGRMGYQLARCGGVVVSGAAKGIDAVAMSSALTAGGTVIGVLGCGADVVYPAANRSLYGATAAQGCLLTEYPPETPPLKSNFPRRNRIISGLCSGVLVVEAPQSSGALITARQALEQGRDVFVVPGNVDAPSCVGSNALLREGAVAVTDGWDIMSEYEAQYPDRIRKVEDPEKLLLQVAQTPLLPQYQEGSEKKVIDNGEASPYIDGEKSLPPLSEEEQAIVAQLLQGEKLTADVAADSGIPVGRLLAVLTMLEVKGVITRLPGDRLALK